MRGSDTAPRRSLGRQARTFAVLTLAAPLLFACEFVTHSPDYEQAPAAIAGDCPGATKCGESCVNLASDPANCGACGTACPANGFCVSSMCMNQCPAPSMVCGGQCVDVLTDPGNCSACGMACAVDVFCSDGACKPCPAGTDACGKGDARRCVDTKTDPANCGDCAAAGDGVTTGKCPPDKPLCVDRVCAASCPAPLVVCTGACVDTSSDPAHCGTCAKNCAAGLVVNGSHQGTQLCNAGACVTVCGQGLTTCGTDCVDVTSDPKNCGHCGNACIAGGATNLAKCLNGSCCTAGLAGCPQ